MTLQYSGHNAGAFQFCDEAQSGSTFRDENKADAWGASIRLIQLSISKSRTKILNVEISRVSIFESSGLVVGIIFCARVDTKAAPSAASGDVHLKLTIASRAEQSRLTDVVCTGVETWEGMAFLTRPLGATVGDFLEGPLTWWPRTGPLTGFDDSYDFLIDVSARTAAAGRLAFKACRKCVEIE